MHSFTMRGRTARALKFLVIAVTGYDSGGERKRSALQVGKNIAELNS